MPKYRIDLHTHTSSSIINGDLRIDFESVEKSLLKFKNYNVSIAAFSDHNRFDVDQYKKARDLAKQINILFLPAIEVNVTRNSDNSIANIIYIFKEDLTDKQLNEISLIARKEIPKKGISNNEINSIFKDFETIIIPHIGKSDSFKIEDLKDIHFDAIEISSLKHPNYLRTIKQGYKGSIVAFSDTHIWKKYPELGELITEIEMGNATFVELKKALRKNVSWVKER